MFPLVDCLKRLDRVSSIVLFLQFLVVGAVCIAPEVVAFILFILFSYRSCNSQVDQSAEHSWNEPMNDTATLQADDNVKDYASFWKSVKLRFYNPSTGQSKESYVNYLTSNSNTQTITTDKITTVFPAENNLKGYTTIQGIYIGKFPGDETLYKNSLKSILKEEKLEVLDNVS